MTVLFMALLISLLATGCAPAGDFDADLKSIVRPYQFNFVSWEFAALQHETRQLSHRQQDSGEEVNMVLEYFSLGEQIEALASRIATSQAGGNELAALGEELERLREEKLALQGAVERILEKQVRDILARQGIFSPLDRYIRLRLTFPPMNFKLEKPPLLLVISPRDRIESIREISLQPDLELTQIEDIEASADGLGVSSLVVELGGLGATYPTFVTNQASLRFTLNAVAEEWLHQYLAFQPLGFLYVLDLTGLSPDYEIATINETVASIVSKEIGAMVYEQLYRQHEDSPARDEPAETGFDFNREMREIRRAVDAHLARGEIAEAEQFMEEKRQLLASHGHYIRKLNQAYFAFHDVYADRPTSISPIGQELRELRARSTSLKDFLNAAAGVTSRGTLQRLLEEMDAAPQ